MGGRKNDPPSGASQSKKYYYLPEKLLSRAYPGETAQSSVLRWREVMRNTFPALASGFAVTLLTFVALWQLMAVALLVRAMAGVLGVLGRLF